MQSLTEAVDLSSEGQVMEEFKDGFEPVEIISAMLEMPEVIMCVPRAFSLIVIRDHAQWSSILAAISGNNADNVGIRSHD